jgi:hypothetical protein
MGTNLVRRQRVALRLTAILLLSVACAKTQQVRTAVAAGPQVRARVLNIQVTTSPDNGRFFASVAISPQNLVRLTDEVDHYRLFDMEKKTVTYVDTIAKTYRTDTFDAAMKSRRQLVADGNENAPLLKLAETGQTKTINGVAARQLTLTLGAYHRDIWLSTDSLTPEPLFPIIFATEPVAAPYASTYRDVLGRLSTVKGFPVLDRSEMPFRDKMMTVEKTVTSIQQKDVPESLFAIPDDFREVKAPVTPVGTRPTAKPRTAPAPPVVQPQPVASVAVPVAPSPTETTTAVAPSATTTNTAAEPEKEEGAKKTTAAKEPESTKKPTAGKTSATKPAAKKAAVKKAPVKKAPAKRAPAKKAPAKKTPAEKTPAEKTPAEKTPTKSE